MLKRSGLHAAQSSSILTIADWRVASSEDATRHFFYPTLLSTRL